MQELRQGRAVLPQGVLLSCEVNVLEGEGEVSALWLCSREREVDFARRLAGPPTSRAIRGGGVGAAFAIERFLSVPSSDSWS